MRKLLILLLVAVMPLSAQTMFQDFNYVTVTGTVVTPDNKPVVACNVELRTLSQGGMGTDVLSSGSRNTTDLDKAGWGRTDENGVYRIDGIPAPGSYVIVVKGVKGYKQGQKPLRIDEGADEIDAGKLILQKFKDLDSKTKKLLKKAGKSLSSGNIDEAEKLLKEVDARTPDLPEVYVSFGNIYIKRKNYPAAYDAFRKAFDLGERNPDLCRTTAKMAFQFQKFDEALDFLDVVIADDAKDLNSVYLAGVCAYNLKDFNRAEGYFEQYLEGKGGQSSDVNFLYVFGMTELALEKMEPATTYLHSAYRLGFKADVTFLKTLANAYISLDRKDEAKAVLKDLLDKYPNFLGREQAQKVYDSM